jgi:hypothetical protein
MSKKKKMTWPVVKNKWSCVIERRVLALVNLEVALQITLYQMKGFFFFLTGIFPNNMAEPGCGLMGGIFF